MNKCKLKQRIWNITERCKQRGVWPLYGWPEEADCSS